MRRTAASRIIRVDVGSHSRARRMEGQPVEMAIGLGLVVISAILIIGIVRVVSANLNIGR